MDLSELMRFLQALLIFEEPPPHPSSGGRPKQVHAAIPDLLPDLVAAVQMVQQPAALFERGAELHPEVFAFRVAWERWTILRGVDGHRFFFRLTPEDVDPFLFRTRMPTLAIPGVRPPVNLMASARLTKQLLARLFQQQGLDGLIDAILTETRSATDALLPDRDGQIDDFFGVWLELCVRAVSRALHGPALHAELPEQFPHWYRDIEAGLSITRLLVPWWPSVGTQRSTASMQALAQWLRSAISQRRQATAPPDDLLQGYINGGEVDGEPIRLDDDAILWTFNSVQWAAHHYPAVHAFWTGMEFLSHKDLLARLIDEQAQHPRLDAAAVSKMHLLRGCILEGLRSHPLVALPRVVRRDLHHKGIRLPAGSVVAISPYLSHHDPANFPDPHVFDPDRWHPSRAHPPALSFVPGGGGRWGCVGLRLTVSMLSAMWAHMLRTWEFELDGKPPQIRLDPMLMPPRRATTVRYYRKTDSEQSNVTR
jgi:sterol 14-demethylase